MAGLRPEAYNYPSQGLPGAQMVAANLANYTCLGVPYYTQAGNATAAALGAAAPVPVYPASGAALVTPELFFRISA
jgi:hypothetical protein